MSAEDYPETKRQFTLAFSLLVFLVVALSLAVFGPAGILIGLLMVGLAWAIRNAAANTHRYPPTLYSRWIKPRWIELMCVLLILALAIVVIPPQVARITPAAILARCRDNLQQIGLTLRGYQDAHGTLPPVREADSQGQPQHSWRLLLQLHLGQKVLLHEYQRNEPWNSPNNRSLAGECSRFYLCPFHEDLPHKAASYVAAVGPDGNWLPARDDRNPVRVVEVSNSGIQWMEPRDLPLESLWKITRGLSGSGLSSDHVIEGNFFIRERPAGAHALFADGSVRLIPSDVPTEVLREALLGDRAKQEELETRGSALKYVNWPNCAALAGLVLCAVALLTWAIRGLPKESQMPRSGPSGP